MQETARSNPPPAMGGIREDVIHRMGRRCREWDYSARAIYLVTVCLKERGRPVLAEWPEFCASPETAKNNLAVSGEARNARRKTLGDIVRGFKTGCREVGWEDGYVDNILFREGQLAREIEYLRDNPRRLYEKRANPERFRRVVDLPVVLGGSAKFCTSPETAKSPCASPETAKSPCASPETAKSPCASPETAKFTGHFQALGNAALLRRPVLLQVQCSRSDFRYRRERLPGGGWKILRDAAGNPLVEYASPAFEERCADVLRCAGNGAVIVSPCISHGEREIARRANAAGAPLVALRNKGFSRIEKPGGRLFDLCARGNLLLLAPAAWPHVPGEKPPTRESSLVLNRIAQLLCGENAADIDYRGAIFSDIDSAVRTALRPPASNTGDPT